MQWFKDKNIASFLIITPLITAKLLPTDELIPLYNGIVAYVILLILNNKKKIVKTKINFR